MVSSSVCFLLEANLNDVRVAEEDSGRDLAAGAGRVMVDLELEAGLTLAAGFALVVGLGLVAGLALGVGFALVAGLGLVTDLALGTGVGLGVAAFLLPLVCLLVDRVVTAIGKKKKKRE